MSKITLSLAALGALMFVGLEPSSAEAAHGWGLHIGGRNVHLDIGNPHGRRYASSRATTYARPYADPRGCSNNVPRAHYDWHDTSHFDYIPPRYVPHGNHVDYVPGRHVWHRDGHWDKHYGGHRGGYRGGHPGGRH